MRPLRHPDHECHVHLTEHGSRVVPTQGDVYAMERALVRLFRGVTIRAMTRAGELLVLTLNSVTVGGLTVFEGNAHDCVVTAYGLISSFNEAWAAFDDRDFDIDGEHATLWGLLAANHDPDIAPLASEDIEALSLLPLGASHRLPVGGGWAVARRVS